MGAFLFSMLVAAAGSTSMPATVRECTAAQSAMDVASIPWEVARAHRRFPEPSISYAFGTHPSPEWGFRLQVWVGADGRILCYLPLAPGSRPPDGRIRTAMASMGNWRYEPFLVDGKPKPFVAYVLIREEERPEREQPIPAAPLDAYAFTLERTVCYGRCPAYRVTVRGNGRVEYEGKAFVGVVGRRVATIPRSEVARLVAAARDGDLWSMRASYVAGMTDMPTYRLTLTVGSRKHTIEDYAGYHVGMPRSVSDFEDLIDEIGRTRRWIVKPDVK